ncbi:hypothetical protein O3P69_005695 [Scylla paramamosain]|uniref:Uncharacterized protein n=1 Tax=Scylla paramamosain TaxID=85552 RepID=A0AAW0U6R2_SCYPA
MRKDVNRDDPKFSAFTVKHPPSFMVWDAFGYGGCQPRPLARKLWERQGQFRKSQAVLEPFVAVLANSRSPSLLVLAKTESMKHGRRRSGTIRRKEERILLLYGLDQPQLYSPECCSSAYEEDFVRLRHGMWKRAVWLEGKKEEEGVVPSSWVLEENQTLFWPQGVNAENALHNQQEPDPASWRKFMLKKKAVHMKPASQKPQVTTSQDKVASAPSQVVLPTPPPKVSLDMRSTRTHGMAVKRIR